MNAVISTTIVNLRFHKADINCSRGVSVFGNPFIIGRDGTRDDVCDKFVSYFFNKLRDNKFREEVLKLKGYKLGCWCRCYPPCNNPNCKSLRCHLETIVEYIDNYL